jgi:hypothetical protein
MEPATKPATAPPPCAANGVLNGSAPTPQTAAAPKTVPAVRTIFFSVLKLAADLRITVALFALAMVIVFWGTIAQVDNGLWTVVQKYFRSALVWVPLRVILFNQIESNGPEFPFPGGWLIGGAMLVNLLAAHAIRFKFTWNRGGIILIHAGVIVMMLSEVITGVYAVEGQMIIQIGTSSNNVIHPGAAEFVVIRTLDDKTDEVISVPRKYLQAGAVLDDPRLPFVMEIIEYMVNSDIRMAKPGEVNPDAKGNARNLVAFEVKEVAGVAQNQRHDAPSMYAKLTDRKGNKLGKWLFTAHIENQYIQIPGEAKPRNVNLRFKQTQREFSLHLKDFKHEVFPGTMTPKDFHSYIVLTDEEAGIAKRDVEIFMNAPLSYKGETFYQQSWTTDPMTRKANGTILQVVRNPGWSMPYIACFMVGFGMLYHFGITLYKFVDRRIVR